MESTPGEKPTDNKVLFILRAFRHRNYRLFFSGQSISLTGTWMQQVALSWLVYRLTDSAFLLGFVSFISQTPTFLLASLAGVYADRWDRRKALLVLQSCAMVVSFTLAFLALTHLITVWHIILLSALQGIVTAFDMPARHSFVADIVDDRADLGNAIALNSSMFNGTRLIGPSIAGFVISLAGEGGSFLLNGLSFIAIIIALALMRIPGREKTREGKHALEELKDGFRYAFGFPPIRYILLLTIATSFMGAPYIVLLPVFAGKILGGGAQTLGFLMAASGCGALFGAFHLASRKTLRGISVGMSGAACLMGVSLIAFSFSKIFILSFIIMFFTGLGTMMVLASANTVIQTIVEEDKRGRVAALLAMFSLGVAPFGALLAGSLAGSFGAPRTLIIGGSACVVAGVLFFLKRPAMRDHVIPVFIERGLIEGVPGDRV